MTKSDLAILERIFDEDVAHAVSGSTKPKLPTQFLRSQQKRAQRLAAEGYIEQDVYSFRTMTVRGWRLTALGHLAYCTSCEGTIR